MTRLNNLGFQSEFVISQLEAKLIEQPEFIVLQTASNPNYYFGNLLALSVSLNKYTKEEWLNKFKVAFSNMPEVNHYTFSWVRDEFESQERLTEFMDGNFEYEEMHILAMTRSDFQPSDKLNEQVMYRPLESASDWDQWLELSLLEQTGDYLTEGLRQYLSLKAYNYQQLAKANLGEYLGAFKENRLIGYAGLYHRGTLARFQNVHVIKEFQNSKIATTLLTKLIQRSTDTIKTFVILADEHYHATELYQRLGFTIVERECSLCWWPESHRKTQA